MLENKYHKGLIVWQKSIDLVTEIYTVTKDFPNSEIYGLTNQMRRSAVSIPSNIAEGAARRYNKEFIQFLYIALGSLSELETQIIISKNLEYLKNEKFSTISETIIELRKMIIGLIKNLNSKLN